MQQWIMSSHRVRERTRGDDSLAYASRAAGGWEHVLSLSKGRLCDDSRKSTPHRKVWPAVCPQRQTPPALRISLTGSGRDAIMAASCRCCPPGTCTIEWHLLSCLPLAQPCQCAHDRGPSATGWIGGPPPLVGLVALRHWLDWWPSTTGRFNSAQTTLDRRNTDPYHHRSRCLRQRGTPCPHARDAIRYRGTNRLARASRHSHGGTGHRTADRHEHPSAAARHGGTDCLAHASPADCHGCPDCLGPTNPGRAGAWLSGRLGADGHIRLHQLGRLPRRPHDRGLPRPLAALHPR